MPEQAMWTTANYCGRRAARLHRLMSLKEWQASCNRDAQVVTTPETIVAESDSDPAGEYVQTSRYIDGSIKLPESGRWPMNYCNHIVSGVNFPSDALLDVERHTILDETFEVEEGECSNYDYVHYYRDIKDRFQVTLGEDHWHSRYGTGQVVQTHPYIAPNGQTFRDKILELDAIAMDAMVPELEGKFSLPVFIAELADLRKMVLGVVEFLRHLPSQVLRLLSRPLSELGNQWLAAVFGWLPFVSDIKTIVTRMREMPENLFRFYANANKRQTLHFKKGLSPYTFREESWFTGEEPFSMNVLDPSYHFLDGVLSEISGSTRYTRTVEVDYFATMEFEYRIPNLDAFTTHLCSALDYWGVNFSPSDIWEVIPFSFVVDWVVDVGSWLEGFDTSNLNVQVVIYDYCRTIKYDYVRTDELASIDYVYDANDILMDGVWTSPVPALASHVVKAYYRTPGVPVFDETGLATRLPKGWTIVTAVALANVLSGESLTRLLERTLRRI